jgi:hypothetical protein
MQTRKGKKTLMWVERKARHEKGLKAEYRRGQKGRSGRGRV